MKWDDIKDDVKYVIDVNCMECKTTIHTSRKMTGKKIKDNWTKIVFSSPLATPKCPKCNYSSFSDCNSHTDLVIREA